MSVKVGKTTQSHSNNRSSVKKKNNSERRVGSPNPSAHSKAGKNIILWGRMRKHL